MTYAKPMRQHNLLDRITVKERISELRTEIDEKTVLGEDFVSDKLKLEEQIEIINSSNISNEDKKEILVRLEKAIDEIKKEYEEQVLDTVKDISQDIKYFLSDAEEKVDLLNEHENSLKEVQLCASSVDLSEAIGEIYNEKSEFKWLHKKETDEFYSQVKVLELQQRKLNINKD